MQLQKLYDGPGNQGPYHTITHFPFAGKEQGFSQMEVICSIMEKGGVGSRHSHPHCEHVMIVFEGSLRINAGKTHFDILPGYALLMKPDEFHEVVNSYDGPTRYMVIYAPPRS